MSDPLTNPTPLPTPGQTPNWGRQLLAGIRDRTDPLRQLVTSGRLSPDVLSATIGTVVESKAGNVPTFGTQAEAIAWEADHPGQVALWFDAGYQEVTAAGPTWEDTPLTGGGSWSTPTEAGVTYTPASGTAEPGETITVVAAPRPGYALVGTKSWTHTFPMSTDMLLTDFTEYTRDAIPADWTARWVIPTINGWKVETLTAATGGAALVHRGADNARRSISWNAAAALDTVDVEVVFKWRTSNTNPARGVVRGAGAATTEHGYMGGVRNATNQALNKFVNGTGTLPLGPQAPTNIVADTWYVTRLRAQGDQLSAKTWAAAEPEPSAWAVATNDTDISADGWVGLHAFGAGVMAFDWVGVAIDGKTAPKGP